MVNWTRPLGLIVSVALLSSCSMFSKEEPIEVMAPLPEFSNSFEVDQQWHFQVGDGVGEYYSQLSPTVAYEMIFAAERFGRVYGLSLQGKELWSTDLSKVAGNNQFSGNTPNARISGGLTAAYQHLYLGTENADMFALDAQTGEVTWQQDVPGEVIAPPAVDDSTLVAITGNGHLFALDAIDGSLKWDITMKLPALTLRGNAAPVIAQEMVFVGRSDGHMAFYSLKDGRQLFDVALASAKGSTDIDRLVDSDAKPLIAGTDAYSVAYNGNLLAIDLSNGKEKWRRSYSAYQSMSLAGSDLFISDSRSHIYSVERYNGSEQWVQSSLEYRSITPVVVDGNYVLVGDAQGYLYWLDRETGSFVSKQSIDKNGLYVAPLVYDDTVLIQTRSGQLIALERQ